MAKGTGYAIKKFDNRGEIDHAPDKIIPEYVNTDDPSRGFDVYAGLQNLNQKDIEK